MFFIFKNFSFKRFLTVFLSFLLIIAILFFVVDSHIRELICSYSASMGETIMIKTVDTVISEIFTDNNISYGDMVTLERNNDGLVTSLQINAEKINYIKSQISIRVAKHLENKEKYPLLIPIGTLIGNEYTIGRGPDIKFKMQITTTVIADFESIFYSAGINQVLHRIIIKVTMNGQTLVPWYRSAFTAKTSCVAAETVIVGIVPDAFTNVIEGENADASEDIFDYGASLN